MIRNKFHSFINFGSIGTRKSRTRLADGVYDALLQNTKNKQSIVSKPKRTNRPSLIKGKSEADCGGSNRETEIFSCALKKIIADKNLLLFCANNTLYAEVITLDILDFVDGVKKKLLETSNPYSDERMLLEDFSQITKNDFDEIWDGIASYINDIYTDVFDTGFYTEKFKKSFRVSKKKNNALSFESVKDYFADRWNYLLTEKTRIWEKEFINAEKETFLQEIKRRIENLKTVSKTLEPGTEELGRLWNLTKGTWRKASYDVLSNYSDYFAKDITLQELARRLGRSRIMENETETEEEVYCEWGFEQIWELNENGKAELIGVHTGDDISAILPAEIALLMDEDTEFLFLKKFTEKKLQTFHYLDKQLVAKETTDAVSGKRKKREAMGPFILCIDTSGSMRGEAERIAKTMVFALLKFALKEKRLCYLISFSTEIETLEISSLASHLDTLTEFLSMSFNGGSNAGPAFLETLAMLEKDAYRKADVVMISDFILPQLDGSTADRIKAAQSQKTLFHGVLVGDIGDNAVNRALLESFDTTTAYPAFPSLDYAP
ncbi:MAG: VWA domain-containing protein [Spirochaetaceae bacterium]|jgi:uncharacterized protein with von Willebrand factor type A (vWA) domain|nr:VWA domain-containing protein [Spirochaetaceae bacterium]